MGSSDAIASSLALMLAALALSFNDQTQSSQVIPSAQKDQIAQTLEDDAQVVSTTQLDKVLA